jgi:hypothetical protein
MENLTIINTLLTVCNSFLLLVLLRLFMEGSAFKRSAWREPRRPKEITNDERKTHCVDSLEELYEIFVKAEGDMVFVLDENKFYIFHQNVWKCE